MSPVTAEQLASEARHYINGTRVDSGHKARALAAMDGLAAEVERLRVALRIARGGVEPWAKCAACGGPDETGCYPKCMSAARPGWSAAPCQPARAALPEEPADG